MNAPFRFAVKACLVTATGGFLLSQVAGISAQDNDTPSAARPVGAPIKQVQATSPDAAGQGAQPSSQEESDVQKQLRKMYKKNGREMPTMNINELPNTQSPASPQKGAQNAAQNAAPGKLDAPALQPAKPNWFERTFHIGKGRKKPAPATQIAASATPPAMLPTPPPTAPYRYPSTAPVARPASPTYRAPVAAAPAKPAPVVAGPAAPASPAQPQFREPAPLGPATAARDVAERSTPPSVRPARPSKDSQPLLDESGANGDSESLELDEEESKVAGLAPQVLPSQTAHGAAESPYSGLKISPNETERQFVSSRPRAFTADEPTGDTPVLEQLPIDFGAAGRPTVDELAPPNEKSTSTSPAATKSKSDDLELKDEDDDEDMLSLPASEPRKHADVPVDKTEKTPEKPLAPAPFNGLKGICPVVLKDHRKLLDAQPEIKSEFRGKTYTFSSLEAKQAFDENPRKYAPVVGGNDVVRQTSGEADVAGTLEHAAWYRGRLYLFSTADSRHVFVETPSKFVIED